MEEFLWVEKYRPKIITDTILPQELKSTFDDFVKGGIPNLILSGGPGVGKTTVARAMLEQNKSDYIIINGSLYGNIDTLRTEIKNYASAVSLQGGRKYVILDEADYLNPQSTQPALRNFMEEYSNNCGFILTCNYKNRIIEPLHSRCSIVEFNIPNKQKPELAKNFLKRVKYILDSENIQYSDKCIAELIMRYFPDWRRVINELQRYGHNGKIDAGILTNVGDQSFNTLIGYLKGKDFNRMRKWVGDNIDNDTTNLFRKIYDNANEHVKEQTIPLLVTVIADYQYKSAFVADQEVNMVACLTQLMLECDFK
jgi:DNA polymerase III delta prime subunit|tara:strand:- start:1815 stop:2747 length:933 start_codon:yes stop_codon:yes gene_type:complete